MPHSAASDLGLRCLLMSYKKDTRLIWVKLFFLAILLIFLKFYPSVYYVTTSLFEK